MYTHENDTQMTLDGFYVPFAQHLDPNNKWVTLSKLMPWDDIEKVYKENIDENMGRRSISSRIAFGACFIRVAEKLSDERTVEYIAQNPYMQYFLGLKEFTVDPLFDPSMMVHFRKRFPVNYVSDVNEYVCTGKWPEGSRSVDRNNYDDTDDNNTGNGNDGSGSNNEELSKSETNDTEDDSNHNHGKCIMDATVIPSNIKYPTDIDLLNKSRENLETAISILWEYVPHTEHMLPYNKKKAHDSFVTISKSKKWTKKILSKAISEQLRYIELATSRFNTLQNRIENIDDIIDSKFPSWLIQRLEVVPIVYAQQKQMFDNNKQTCENRVVSLHQPHVRPIVRGKRPNPTEFGQKIHISIVDGYTYLEQTSWNNFNESTDLIATVENYKRRFGFYPKAVLADKIYQTKANRKYCKEKKIRLSGPALGRKNQEKIEQEKEQMYKDGCERNIVESRNGILKTRFGLDCEMCKLDETAKTDVAFAILAMNALRKVKELLLRLFPQLVSFSIFQPQKCKTTLIPRVC